jgi:hypothetical protein
MASQLPWDITSAYLSALSSWHYGVIPWEKVRVMLGPIRTFGMRGSTNQQPVCIISCMGWQAGEKVAAIGNRTDVDWRYAVAVLVPDDESDPMGTEKLRQDLCFAFTEFHQQPVHRDLLSVGTRSGRILSCLFENGPFFAEGADLYRIAHYEVAWTARRHA